MQVREDGEIEGGQRLSFTHGWFEIARRGCARQKPQRALYGPNTIFAINVARHGPVGHAESSIVKPGK